MHVRPATSHEVIGVQQAGWRDVADALALAFSEDPVFSWLLPDAVRRGPALRRFFGIEARRIVLRHGHSRGASGPGGLVGAALVLPPGTWRTPYWVQGAFAPAFVRIFGTRLGHALGVLTQLEHRHPRVPHYYLPYIGVVALAQGQGVGSAMLAPVLGRCDREGLPAYLEASSPRSAALYRRLGFRTVQTIRPLGAPPIELMTRAPAQP